MPGVGSSYNDHTLILWPFTTNLDPADTHDAFFSGRMSKEDCEAKDMLRWNGSDVHFKIRPSEADIESFNPELRAAWDRDYKESPSRPFMLGATLAA